MKKSFFGIKIGTVIQFILCLAFAFAIWISVKYTEMYSNENNESSPDEETTAMCSEVEC